MSERVDVTVATPWYPTPYNRMAGSFVAEHAALTAGLPGVRPDGVRVVHALEWPGGDQAAATALRPAFDAVLDRLRLAGGTRVHGVAGPVDRVPVFTVGGADWAQRAEAAVRDVTRAVGPFGSPVVHGHVGYLGGVLAARLAEPGAAVFATEHSTALRDVLAQPAARELYAELLERARAVFCVSDLLRRQILEAVPDPHGVVQVLPNPVDFTGVPRRTQAPDRLRHWVFIGGLHERKGVLRLARAFVIAARQDPELTLTLFGDGPLAEQVASLASGGGVRDRLHLRGVVRHREVLAQLPSHDLLLAPSTYETFHLAVPEAVAAGLPVIVTRSGGPQEALAGVEDQVGRFVDVSDDEDEIVQAWRDLSDGLDRLDLGAARQTLDARYGRAAIARRLAEAYELPARPGTAGRLGGQAAAPEEVEPPERVVLVAVSGWRRYHVEAELDAAARLGVPLGVVSDDVQITAWARGAGASVLGTRQAATLTGGVAVPSAGATAPVTVRVRRSIGALRRRLVERSRTGALAGTRSGARASSANPGSAATPAATPAVDGDFLTGAHLVLGDCQSMPLARAMLAATPSLRPVVELDRVDVLGPTVDSEAGQ
ncbi:MAG: glycosyltransferase family 4 protein [Kineosporiaceae bacterium]|nr:glycosyltransferase family 4 protein [Kineosporiaceae bacterium]